MAGLSARRRDAAVGDAAGVGTSASSARYGETKNSTAKKGKKGKSCQHAAALEALHAHFAGTFDVQQPIQPVATTSASPSRKIGKAQGEQSSKARAKASAGDSSSDAGGKGKSREVLVGSVASEGAKASTKPSRRAHAVGQAPGVRRTIQQVARHEPETVVFGGGDTSAGMPERRPGWRKFMSSKVGKHGGDAEQPTANGKKTGRRGPSEEGREDGTPEDGEDDTNMLANDRALSELLSTTLLAPGAQDTRRASGKQNLGSNATLERLLELSKPTLTSHAASVGRGLGSSTLKAQDMGRMPIHMRHGMRRAEQQRAERSLTKEKELGNYHHSIKGLVGGRREGTDLIMGETDKNKEKRQRQRGLAMGVGSFKGGTLRISDRDVARINESGRSSSNRGGGGGKKRKR